MALHDYKLSIEIGASDPPFAALGDRFWSKVDQNGPVPEHRPDLGQCWVWKAAIARTGYAAFRLNGKIHYGHRLVHESLHGTVPDSHHVIHKCGVRHCVNPTHLTATPRRSSVPEAILERIALRRDGCWEWTGTLTPLGYGRLHTPSAVYMAHRAAYEAFRGPIPNRLVLDHICHVPAECPGGKACPHRRCVNPGHLQITTQAVNNGPGRSSSASKTQCKWGHPFNAENTYVYSDGARACRACGRERARRYKARTARYNSPGGLLPGERGAS